MNTFGAKITSNPSDINFKPETNALLGVMKVATDLRIKPQKSSAALNVVVIILFPHFIVICNQFQF
jgi:hypothetical protein